MAFKTKPRLIKLTNILPSVLRLAKELATAYKHRLKRENFYSKPWSTTIPVEEQRVFNHFVQAALILKEAGGLPRDYIAAQFDGLEWTKTFPFPTQLATDNARLRYMKYMDRKETKKSRAVTEDDFIVDEFDYYNEKLKNRAAFYGISEAEVLKQHKSDFSKAFLRSKKGRV